MPSTEPFAAAIERYLPADIPNRQRLIDLGAKHLSLVVEANQKFNLTAITSPEDLAIKHVFDSLQLSPLVAESSRLLDLGSGAGFPGIPLALRFPEKHVLLAESTQKKARFLTSAVSDLGLSNVEVLAERGEAVLRRSRVDVVVARAVANTAALLRLLAPVQKSFRTALFAKGPRALEELAEAEPAVRKAGGKLEVALHYVLPQERGQRYVVRWTAGGP